MCVCMHVRMKELTVGVPEFTNMYGPPEDDDPLGLPMLAPMLGVVGVGDVTTWKG